MKKIVCGMLVAGLLLFVGCNKSSEKKEETKSNTKTEAINEENANEVNKNVENIAIPPPSEPVTAKETDLTKATSAKTAEDCEKITDPDYKARCYMEIQK